jgi:hypothetical protein
MKRARRRAMQAISSVSMYERCTGQRMKGVVWGMFSAPTTRTRQADRQAAATTARAYWYQANAARLGGCMSPRRRDFRAREGSGGPGACVGSVSLEGVPI